MAIVSDGTHNALTYADPTGNAAVGRASRRHTPTASAEQLRDRLVDALNREDGHGARLIIHLIARFA